MEERTWVVVANAERVHVFLSMRGGPLEMVEAMEEDLSDVPVPAKKEEMAQFAKRVATALDKAFDGGQYKRLYLVAGPAFLGLLREKLSTRVSEVVGLEVAKDLVQVTPEAVRAHLPLVL